MKVRITITLEPIAARGVTSADASSGAVVELPVWSAARRSKAVDKKMRVEGVRVVEKRKAGGRV